MNTPSTETGPDSAFRTRLAAGSFEIQECGGCAQFVFYPRLSCPYCGSRSLTWRPASGTGTIYAVTTVNRRPEAGGGYCIVLVDLDEGPRLVSRINNSTPDSVEIGMRVRAAIDHLPDGEPLVTFDVIRSGE